MKPKEIHDLLLSLLCRGLGFWLLYLYMPYLIDFTDQIQNEFLPDPSQHRSAYDLIYGVIEFAVKIAIAAYFILGAPPFLKRATQTRP